MKGKKKALNASDRKPWNIQMFFRGGDNFFEWSDVLKNMFAWGRGVHHKNTRWDVRFKI